jgi:hypothetical protein
MKHLHLFESYRKSKLVPSNIQTNFLYKAVHSETGRYRRGSWGFDYSQDPPLVNAYGSVTIDKGRKTLSGLHFGKVTGSFKLNTQDFTSVKGFPTEVGEDLVIEGNQIGTLKDLPTKKVGGTFSARACGLTSLEGCPEEVGGNLSVDLNSLTTLEGAPKIMSDVSEVRCHSRGRLGDSPLVSLEGLPPNLDPKNIKAVSSFPSLPSIPQDFLRDGYRMFKETGSWVPYYVKLDMEYSGKGFFTEEFILEKVDPEKTQKFINDFPEKAIVLLTPWLKMKKDPRYDGLKFPESLKDERDLISSLEDIGQ